MPYALLSIDYNTSNDADDDDQYDVDREKGDQYKRKNSRNEGDAPAFLPDGRS